jgi:uncharacterized protein (TIGR03437 family)
MFAPGTLIAIPGVRLADRAATAPAGSLPTTLGGVQVLLGGTPIPLQSVRSDEIVAQIPSAVAPSSSYQLIVLRGDRASLPETVIVGRGQ